MDAYSVAYSLNARKMGEKLRRSFLFSFLQWMHDGFGGGIF